MNFDGMQQWLYTWCAALAFCFWPCYWSNRQIACSSHTHSQNSVFPCQQARAAKARLSRFSPSISFDFFSFKQSTQHQNGALPLLPSLTASQSLCITCTVLLVYSRYKLTRVVFTKFDYYHLRKQSLPKLSTVRSPSIAAFSNTFWFFYMSAFL